MGEPFFSGGDEDLGEAIGLLVGVDGTLSVGTEDINGLPGAGADVGGGGGDGAVEDGGVGGGEWGVVGGGEGGNCGGAGGLFGFTWGGG